MNFLAHALLAGPEETDRIGGVFGDFVKGPLPAGLPSDLASGVALHRAIDSFAEGHASFAASRARISASRRRVGGALVDMFYDHLLARSWSEYATIPLKDFTHGLYTSFNRYLPRLPENAHVVAIRMRADDWLGAYCELSVVAKAIDRMAVHRLRRPNRLAGGIDEFLADSAGFEADFRQFLPDALTFSRAWRAARRSSTRIVAP